MSQNTYVAPSVEIQNYDSDSARCSVGAVVMFGAAAIYWVGAVAVSVAGVVQGLAIAVNSVVPTKQEE